MLNYSYETENYTVEMKSSNEVSNKDCSGQAGFRKLADVLLERADVYKYVKLA